MSYWKGRNLAKAFYAALGIALVLDGLLLLQMVPGALRFTLYDKVLPVPYGAASILSLEAIIVLAVIPPAIAFRRGHEMITDLKYQSRIFLQVYPSIAASAQSTVEALSASASLVERPLRDLIRALANSYRLTGDLEGSFRRVFGDAPRDVRILMSAIPVAGRSGGRAKEVLEVISRYAAELDRMEFTLFNRLRSYAMVVYMGVAVYGVVAGVGVSVASTFTGFALPGSQGLSPLTLVQLLGFMYYALLVLSAASAYVLAKIIDDYAPRSLEYFAFLSALGSTLMVISVVAMHGPGL
ncbi:MAG: type II secretion system F family protein [Acidilobus sp.]